MLKKMSLCLAMLTFLGMGASQLFARIPGPQLCPQQFCCQSNYQGLPFVFSYILNQYEIECHYGTPSSHASYISWCPNEGC